MSNPLADPRRLSCLPEHEDALGIGRMFRNALALPDEELPALRWRLRTSQRLLAIRPRLFLKVALVVGVAFCTGGVVGAMVPPFWASRAPAVVSPTPAVVPTPRQRKARPATATPAPPALPGPVPDEVVPEARPVPPRPVPAAAKHPAAVRVAVLSEPAAVPVAGDAPVLALPPVVRSPIAVEQALLGQAVRVLRDEHDARAALALLAQHAERFPRGALASEETMLRIEALLALARRDEALAILDGIPLTSLPNRDEQLVVRGELRATQWRWREAEQDFDDVLGGPGVKGASPAQSLPAASPKARNLQERALWGRASARSRLGDQAGARADLDLYLRHFPGGRFAGPAASLLESVP